jgi:hypothetical protein
MLSRCSYFYTYTSLFAETMTISTRETAGRREPGSPELGGILNDIVEDPLLDIIDGIDENIDDVEDIDLSDDGSDEHETGIDQSCFDTIGSEISHITAADGSLDSSSILKTPQKGASDHLTSNDSIGKYNFVVLFLFLQYLIQLLR